VRFGLKRADIYIYSYEFVVVVVPREKLDIEVSKEE